MTETNWYVWTESPRWPPRWWQDWRSRRALRKWTDVGYVTEDGFALGLSIHEETERHERDLTDPIEYEGFGDDDD